MATLESIKQPNGGQSNTLLTQGQYDPTTGFYKVDSTRAVAVRDPTGRLLSQDEEADYVRQGKADQLNTTWENIAQKQQAAAPSPEPAAASPAPTPTPSPGGGPTPAAAVAAPAAAPAALKALGAPGAGLQEGGMTPLDTGLGARMLPANSRALATLARQRGGRIY